MHFRSSAVLLVLAAFCACSSDVTAPTSPIQADGLFITVVTPGRCLVGGCDPANSDANTLGLITLENTSGAPVFVTACGTLPALGLQELGNGEWQFVGPAVSCVSGPKSIAIAAHDSLRLNQFFAPGVWRMTVSVATSQALEPLALSASASFTVH
jgi:hypothetical protein